MTSVTLTETEVNEFREIFNLVDKDGGGTISKDELADLMDTLGINATQVGYKMAKPISTARK